MGRLIPGTPEWNSRLTKILTRHSLLRRARDSEEAREAFILRYQKAIKKYVKELLLREKEAPDEQAANRLAEKVFEQVLRRLRAELSKKEQPAWEGDQFRPILLAWIHDTYWICIKRGNLELLDSTLRDDVLRKTWERLEKSQMEEGKNDATLLRLRETHDKQKDGPLYEWLAGKVGGEIKPAALRKQLTRAADRFGRFLLQEMAHLAGDGSADAVQKMLEDLRLMEYAQRSKSCREFLSPDRS